MADYIVSHHGSVSLIQPLTDDAHDNLEEGTDSEAQWFGYALAVEHRYIEQVVEQLREEGWVVE